MTELSARLALPLLAPGQAQKEITHNEAVTGLELLVQAAVEGVAEAPPATPAPGACWIVGANPSGAWTGRGHALAMWTDAGWRFATPKPGTSVFCADRALDARWTGSAWEVGVVAASRVTIGGQQVVGARAAAIAAPAGGSTVDGEARSALNAVLAALRGHGLIG